LATVKRDPIADLSGIRTPACRGGWIPRIPVVVRMRVECARYGHTEDDTYKFDMPFAKAQSMEAYEPGKCRSAARLSI